MNEHEAKVETTRIITKGIVKGTTWVAVGVAVGVAGIFGDGVSAIVIGFFGFITAGVVTCSW